MKILSLLKSFWGWLFDCFRMIGVNRRIAAKRDTWRTDSDFADILTLSDADLTSYIDLEWERARELDSKLSKLTAATSIALTVGGTASKLMFDDYAPYLANLISISLFCLSMVFFLTAAILGFNGLRPKPRYGYGAKYLNIVAKNDDVARETKEDAAGQFQITNMIQANQASAAIDFIRNGILVYAFALLVSWLPTPINDKTEPLTSSSQTEEAVEPKKSSNIVKSNDETEAPQLSQDENQEAKPPESHPEEILDDE